MLVTLLRIVAIMALCSSARALEYVMMMAPGMARHLNAEVGL